jgi:hypothetical protein
VHEVRAAARPLCDAGDARAGDLFGRDERQVEPLRLRSQLDDRAVELHENADRDRFDDQLAMAAEHLQHRLGGTSLTIGQIREARFDRHARRADVGAPNAEAPLAVRAGPH